MHCGLEMTSCPPSANLEPLCTTSCMPVDSHHVSSHMNFQIELAKGLLQQAGKEIEAFSIDPSMQSGTWSEAIPPPLRMVGRHFPEKAPPTPSGRPAVCFVQQEERKV